MTERKAVKIGRLAMRHEGAFWNAYYATPESMEGAILLGSIAMRFVVDRGRQQAFVALMREAVSDLIEEEVGVRPTWPEGCNPRRRARGAAMAENTLHQLQPARREALGFGGRPRGGYDRVVERPGGEVEGPRPSGSPYGGRR